ncbi:MAG: hypothetical protein ACTSYE_08755 [Alphaproteobacteria bacterium]
MNRPFDHLALPAYAQIRAIAGDRDSSIIEAWRERAIDRNFGLTGMATPLQCGLIEKWKPDRPFHLVDVGSGEKNRGRVCIDTLYGF